MKNTTCMIHGSNLRPDLCQECARCGVITTRVLKFSSDDYGAVKRIYDQRGHIGFRLVRPIEAPVNLYSWSRMR